MTGDGAACVKALVEVVERSEADALAHAVAVEHSFQLAVLVPMREHQAPRTPADVADFKAHSRAAFASQEEGRRRAVTASGGISTPTVSRKSGSQMLKAVIAASPDSSSSGSLGPLGSDQMPGSPGMRRLSLLRPRKHSVVSLNERGGSGSHEKVVVDGPLRQGTMFMWVESAEKWKPFWFELSGGELDWFITVQSPTEVGEGASLVSRADTAHDDPSPATEAELRSKKNDNLVLHGSFSAGGCRH